MFVIETNCRNGTTCILRFPLPVWSKQKSRKFSQQAASHAIHDSSKFLLKKSFVSSVRTSPNMFSRPMAEVAKICRPVSARKVFQFVSNEPHPLYSEPVRNGNPTIPSSSAPSSCPVRRRNSASKRGLWARRSAGAPGAVAEGEM